MKGGRSKVKGQRSKESAPSFHLSALSFELITDFGLRSVPALACFRGILVLPNTGSDFERLKK